MQKVYINNYLYLEIEIKDDNAVIRYTNCPMEAISIIKDNEKVKIKVCNKEVFIYDFKEKHTEEPKVNLPTAEVINYAENVNSRGYNTAYVSNKESFEKSTEEGKNLNAELHTHFMEVLSAEEFLNFLLKYIDVIPVNSSDIIVDCPIDSDKPTEIDESKVFEWVKIEDALKKPKIVEQLRVPTDRQVPFNKISEALYKRNSLIDYAGYIKGQENIRKAINKTKAVANDIKSHFKKEIIADLLIESVKTLKDQGIEYVELSYSNSNHLESMIKKLREAKISGITVRFLLSERRDAKAKIYRHNSREVQRLLNEYEEVVGFDVMGFEEEILDSEKEKTGNCKTVYDRLRFTIEHLLESNRTKPTLRIHSGEIFYNREGSPNNNPFLVLQILEEIEKDLQHEGIIEGNLADVLNIRIGHGINFQPTEEYFDKLKHFGVMIELCASSNFSLRNMFDLKEMPYKTYEKHDIPFVLGTDGGGFYLTTLKDESKIASIFGGSGLLNSINVNPPSLPPSKLSKLSQTILSYEPEFDLSDFSLGKITQDYKKDSTKSEFINNYFISLDKLDTLDFEEEKLFPYGTPEIEKVKSEFIRLQSFYHDKVINELYYTTEEEQIIMNNFKKIENYLNEGDYLTAAEHVYSLQQYMGCKSKIEKVALYMYRHNDSIKKVLGLPVITKKNKKDDSTHDGELNKMLDAGKDIYEEFITNKYDDILQKKSSIAEKLGELKDRNIVSLYIGQYFKGSNYNLDIPERGYFNDNVSEIRKFRKELKRTKNFIKRKINKHKYSRNQIEVIESALDNIDWTISYENDLVEASTYLVSLQTLLGMKVKLEAMYIYMYAEYKTIKDYVNVDKYNSAKKSLGRNK